MTDPAPDARPPDLLHPLPLGSGSLPNRIVFGAHLTNFGKDHGYSARHRAYYRARAAGGAGLIVAEALTVHPLDYPYEHVPFGHTEAIVPSLQRLAEELREASPHAALAVIAQLNHTGGQTSGRMLRQSPWAPSPVPDVASKKMAREMDHGQIAQVVEGFAAAADRVARAGLDGVELNAGQYSLLRQFLSPLTNFRNDAYGGDLENRMRIMLSVVEAAREALGAGKVLGVKLCGDELAPWGGLTPEDAGQIAKCLCATGAIDYLSVEIGGPYSVHATDAGMPMPQAHAAPLAGQVRKAVGAAVPVFAEGRIETAAAAREVLAQGQADAAVMTRALVSDPDLPRKLAGESEESIRPHVGMNRYFVVKGDWNRPLGDLANPRAGREALLPPVEPLPLAQREAALVIGGGPAGLEAATTLARLGHRVRLIEAKETLGGMAALLAAQVPAREEFAPLVESYRRELDRLGVEVTLGRAVTGFEPWMDEYRRIFVASGAKGALAPAAGVGIPAGLAALSARELFAPEQAGAPPLPPPERGNAVVVDHEYGYRMANAVEWLLERGYGVDVVTEDLFVGRELVESAEFLWFNRVAEQGVTFHPRTRFAAAEPDAVTVADRFSGRERRLAPVSLLVWAAPEIPDDGLLAAIGEHHGRVAAIGDARAPRLMGEAIQHAHREVLSPRAGWASLEDAGDSVSSRGGTAPITHRSTRGSTQKTSHEPR